MNRDTAITTSTVGPTILIVATHVAPAKGYGGVAESASDLARIWTQQGHTVHLIASDASTNGRITVDQAAAMAGSRVSLYASTHIKKQGLGAAAIPLLWQAIREADRVYIAGVSTWPTTLALLYCRLQRKTFGMGVHGGFLRGHLARIRDHKPIKRLFYRLFVRPLANGARFIHAMSEMEGEHIAPLFSAPVVVAALGVDCAALRPEPPLDPREGGGRRYLYVGRFSPEKSVRAMVRAWPIAARATDRLTLAGDGEGAYAAEVKALAAMDPRITTTGYLPRAQVFELIRQHDFLVMPSGVEAEVRENFGIVVSEALALGRPVLVARSLAWDQLEDHGAGIVFTPTLDGLVDAIKRSGNICQEDYNQAALGARTLIETYADLSTQARVLCHALAAP